LEESLFYKEKIIKKLREELEVVNKKVFDSEVAKQLISIP
jgi:hypothetical protein